MGIALAIGLVALFCGAVYGLIVSALMVIGDFIARRNQRAIRKEAHW
jgi:hypothetical protein